jgi:hypothetical protein
MPAEVLPVDAPAASEKIFHRPGVGALEIFFQGSLLSFPLYSAQDRPQIRPLLQLFQRHRQVCLFF